MAEKTEGDNRTCEELFIDLIREIQALRVSLMARGIEQANGSKSTQFSAGAGRNGSAGPSTAGVHPAGTVPPYQSSVLPPKDRSDPTDQLPGLPMCEALARIDARGELTLLPNDDCGCKALYDDLDEIPKRFLTKRTVFHGDNPCETRGER